MFGDQARALSLRVLGGLWLCLGAILLLSPAAAAAATPEHPFLETFGSAEQPTFTEPASMTVDPVSGDLYVIDSATQTLFRYHADGSPANFSALSGNAIDGHAGEPDEVTSGPPEILSSEGGANGLIEVQVAVAPPGSAGGTEGDIYVTDAENGRIVVFAPSGEYLGQQAIPTYPCGVAVGPSGDVYVGAFEGANAGITKLEPSAPAIFAESAASPFGPTGVCQVAAGSGPTANSVFAAKFNGEVTKLVAGGGAEGTTEYVAYAGGAAGIAVDPGTGHLYVGTHVGEDIVELNASGTSEATEVSSTAIPGGALLYHGVAIDWASGKMYVTKTNGTTVETYGPGSSVTPEFELTITKSGNGTGTVTSTPAGIDCGSECSALFEEGAEVELVAGAGAKSSFTGWSAVSGDPGTCTGTTSPCTIAISEATELEAEFKRKPPIIEGIDPVEGPTAGGNTVTITGTELGEASEVKFGATAVTTLPVDTPTEIEVEAPAHAAGTVDVTVTTPGGSSATGPADQYTFVELPAVTGLSPATGPTAGGNVVAVSGTDLGGASKVAFGTRAVSCPGADCELASPTLIKVAAPEQAAGAVDVTVTTVGGTSIAAPADRYAYVAQPAVTGLSPARGSTAGGNAVTIAGLRLGGASRVEFGGAAATIVADSDTAITAIAPPGAGTVDVRVTTLGGTSGKFAQDKYTYMGPVALTITRAGDGSGSVSCDGGGCAPSYPFGAKVTITAGAASGSSFSGFSGGGCSGTGPCTVTLEAPTAVTATFAKNAPPSTPPPPKRMARAKVSPRATVKGNKASLRIECKGPGTCAGTLKLTAKLKGKNKTIGKASFSVAAGKAKTLKVKIADKQIRKLLHRGKVVKAKVNGPGLSGTVKLKKAAAKKGGKKTRKSEGHRRRADG